MMVQRILRTKLQRNTLAQIHAGYAFSDILIWRITALGRTRNLGIAQARANIIAFLDSDDIWFSDKLAHDVDVLRKNPSACAVFSNSLYWWHDQGEPAWVDRFSPPIDCVWPRERSFEARFSETNLSCRVHLR